MAKRYGKGFDNDSSPAKRAKIFSPRRGTVPRQDRKYSIDGPGRINNDDLWGDDFDDDAIEEMDFIASQACSQDVNASIDTRTSSDPRREAAVQSSPQQPVPSTSRASNDRPTNIKLFRLKEQHGPLSLSKNANGTGGKTLAHSQKLASSDNLKGIVEDERGMVFDDFKTNLLGRENLNSTFRPKNDVVLVSETDETSHRRLEKLEQENKKLLDDFMTKEGETVFLRSQLHQAQLRADNEKIEKARFIEEQASRHRTELNALHKEKENLKTQNEFQTLQLGTLMERCKLLESGTVKLTQPQKAILGNDSPNRTRFGNPNRSASAVKPVKVSEISVQTTSIHRSNSVLKTWLHDHPLDDIPQSIFEPSLPEKSVVDIQIVEKIGKKNLPILQEEDTFRIFENPVLVKPIVTTVDGRQLNVEYFLPDVAVIMKKTRAEINSKDCIPIVNKIVSTTRELLMNSMIVLQTILAAMKNDDIRDMNDLFFSDFYDNTVVRDRSICDSNVWYEKERGIEARRAMGTLSYVAEASNYLGEYIAGKTRLIVEKDQNYVNYNEQMIRYSAWDKKDKDFEMLEMILEFVTALGLVRRSHQFSGLICAIARTLCNVQKRVGFCPRGMEYVTNIFKEMVFSRPLLCCFLPMTKMMEIFCKSNTFKQRLCCFRPNVTSLRIWKGVRHFTPDACPLEIYMAQMKRFRLDPITTIETSDVLLSFVHLLILTESIPWTTESSNSCNCCTMVVRYAITLLCNCSRIDLRKIEKKYARSGEQASTRLSDNFWLRVRKKQTNALKKGIRFLSYLAKRDPDFIIRESDIEDSFCLFMQRVSAFDELTLHENEQEALALINLTLSLEKPAIMEPRTQQSKQIFSIKSAFEEKPVPSPSSGRWYDVDGKKSSSQQAIAMYRDVLNG